MMWEDSFYPTPRFIVRSCSPNTLLRLAEEEKECSTNEKSTQAGSDVVQLIRNRFIKKLNKSLLFALFALFWMIAMVLGGMVLYTHCYNREERRCFAINLNSSDTFNSTLDVATSPGIDKLLANPG